MTPLNNEGLTHLASDEKITQVLHQLNPLSALGPDGMHAIFFQIAGVFLKRISMI